MFPSQFLLSLKYQNPGGAAGRVLGWTGWVCDRTPLQVRWGGESLSPSISPSPFSQPHSHPIPSLPSTTCLLLSPPCSLHVLPHFWGSSDPDQGIPVITCAPCSSCPSWCFQSPISCWEKPELRHPLSTGSTGWEPTGHVRCPPLALSTPWGWQLMCGVKQGQNSMYKGGIYQ